MEINLIVSEIKKCAWRKACPICCKILGCWNHRFVLFSVLDYDSSEQGTVFSRAFSQKVNYYFFHRFSSLEIRVGNWVVFRASVDPALRLMGIVRAWSSAKVVEMLNHSNSLFHFRTVSRSPLSNEPHIFSCHSSPEVSLALNVYFSYQDSGQQSAKALPWHFKGVWAWSFRVYRHKTTW